MGSLWKISDEATVAIMEEFYRRYFAGEGFGACYRRAMEAARKLNDHPYYWGAFVLSGRY
jgi:CHAT domain-containing protein